MVARLLVLVATALIIGGALADTARARPVSGVLFGDTLVSSEGDRYWDLLWVNCEGAADLVAQLKCETAHVGSRVDLPPRCFVGDVEPAPQSRFFMRSEGTLLVKHIDQERPFVGADGGRNCRLLREEIYHGLYSWQFEHSGFVPSPGENWWIDLQSLPLDRIEQDAAQIGSASFVCVEVRGVAMPEREYGYGHMGAYNRLLFVTEVLRSYPPNHRLIESDTMHADHRACVPPSGNWNE